MLFIGRCNGGPRARKKMPENWMDRIFLFICIIAIIFFFYLVLKRVISGLLFPFTSFEGKVVSRSYTSKAIEEEDDTKDIEEKYMLEIKMPDGKTKSFTVNSRLYSSVKEGDYVRKEKGSTKLKKAPRAGKKKKNQKKKS